MVTEKIPLFDLDDNLLGYSCRSYVSELNFLSGSLTEEGVNNIIGINKFSKDVSRKYTGPWGLSYEYWWFQPA